MYGANVVFVPSHNESAEMTEWDGTVVESELRACTTLLLVFEVANFAYASCVCPWCIKCHYNKMTLVVPNIYATVVSIFGTPQL